MKIKLYVGIDLHSTNNYIGIMDENSKRILSRRVSNDKQKILLLLSRYQDSIQGIVVESTYNWYWLIDTLMEAQYRVHLANPAAIQQYEGIKYLNDKHDAFWLAEMLKLGILPEGFIYPKESRGIRDLLRLRSRMVQKRTAFKFMLEQVYSNQAGVKLSNNAMEKLKEEEIEGQFMEEEWQLHAMSHWRTIEFLESQIKRVEKYLLKKTQGDACYKGLLGIAGIGPVLGLTITLETGPIARFSSAGDYASYSRCVPSAYWSNKKKKGSGNAKSGNRYLAWAYAEAANFCIRFNPLARAYYQRKMAKTSQPSAYRAVANKLAKACYFVMRDGVAFDARKIFGS